MSVMTLASVNLHCSRCSQPQVHLVSRELWGPKFALSGENRFAPGDLVELYRTPPIKDISGWTGPYEVVECKAADGIVALKINGQTRPHRLQDVRLANYFTTVSLCGRTNADICLNAMEYFHNYIS